MQRLASPPHGGGNESELPEPIELTIAELSIPELAELYEGVLVALNELTVTLIDGQRVELNGSVEVELRYLENARDWLVVGTEFERILGIVDYRDGCHNLVPRIASDMPRPPAALDGCVPISSSYIFCREGLGWRNANRECIRRGARLVVLETGEENELAGELVARWHDGSFWIGLSDTANEGEFVWVNGDELTYSGWAVVSPMITERRGLCRE